MIQLMKGAANLGFTFWDRQTGEMVIQFVQLWDFTPSIGWLRSANVNSLDFYAVGRLLGKGAFGKAAPVALPRVTALLILEASQRSPKSVPFVIPEVEL